MPAPRPNRSLSRRTGRPPAVGKATGAISTTAPKATTVRLKPELITGLSLLQRILKKPMNRMINEAVGRYVERQASEVEADLQNVLERVKAYRRSDPNYKKLWAEFVDAEARYGKDDPAEGRTKSAGPLDFLHMTMGSIDGLAGVLVWTSADRFPAMARFYRDTLGLAPRSAKADFINFDWHGVRLSVGVHDRVGGTSQDPLRLMVNLTVTDISAVHDRLVRAGVVFTRAPEREEWGGWVATFADPDGNVLQLMQLP